MMLQLLGVTNSEIGFMWCMFYGATPNRVAWIFESKFFTEFEARFERFERFFYTIRLEILLQNERFERFLNGLSKNVL